MDLPNTSNFNFFYILTSYKYNVEITTNISQRAMDFGSRCLYSKNICKLAIPIELLMVPLRIDFSYLFDFQFFTYFRVIFSS